MTTLDWISIAIIIIFFALALYMLLIEETREFDIEDRKWVTSNIPTNQNLFILVYLY